MLKTGEQLRIARALLSIDIGSLAKLSNVAIETIERMEQNGQAIIDAKFHDVLRVNKALNEMGIEFHDDKDFSVKLNNKNRNIDYHTVESEIKNRILIADDDPISRDILSRRLSRHGFVITTAATGAVALSLLTTSRFHAALLDSMMPEMTGLEVLRRLRASKNHTRSIMVTGKAFMADIDEAMALGADGYVTKPVDFQHLLRLIRGT